jgi:hypothetical protein
MIGLSLGLTRLAGHNAWWPAGASMAADFDQNRAMLNGVATSMDTLLSTLRSSTAYAAQQDNTLSQFGANQPRITNAGLTIEPAATNLALQSEDYSQAVWNKTNLTVTAGASDGPRGVGTMTRVEAAATANTSLNQTGIIADSTSQTFSITIKKGSGAVDANRFFLRNVTTATDIGKALVDYNLGTVSSTIGAVTLKDLGNQTYLLSITAIAGITIGDTLQLFACFAGAGETAGEYAYIDMVQLEAGATATSYMPTTTGAATRAADDVTTGLGAGNFPQNFTVFLDFTPKASLANARLFSTTDSRGNNNTIRTDSTATWKATSIANGGLFFDIKASDFIVGTRTKIAFSVQDNGDGTLSAFIVQDGVIRFTNTAIPGTINHSNYGGLGIGHWSGTNEFIHASFLAVTLFPTGLGTPIMQSLTA